MPDEHLAKSLITTARRLVPKQSTRPTQANLRRAISTSYYAVFHALAKCSADALIGATKASRPNHAWVEVYRGLVHGPCKQACREANKINFPADIHDFCDEFVQLQEARHSADYDPMVRYSKEDALLYISRAEKSIKALNSAKSVDKKAFAAWVLITSTGAKEARKKAKAKQDSL